MNSRNSPTDGDPIACAIANVLTDAEIEQALTAPSVAHATHGEALRALPVYPYLTPEQRERARLMRVAEDAMEEAPSAANGDPGCEVMKALVGDLAERRGAKPNTNATFQEIVEDLPEPWRRSGSQGAGHPGGPLGRGLRPASRVLSPLTTARQAQAEPTPAHVVVLLCQLVAFARTRPSTSTGGSS